MGALFVRHERKGVKAIDHLHVIASLRVVLLHGHDGNAGVGHDAVEQVLACLGEVVVPVLEVEDDAIALKVRLVAIHVKVGFPLVIRDDVRREHHVFVVGWPDADAVAVGRAGKASGRRDACHDPVFVSGSQIRQEWGGLVVRLEQGKVDGVRVLVGRLTAQGDEVVMNRQRGLAVFDDAHGNAPSGAARQHELAAAWPLLPRPRFPGPFPGLAVQRPLLNGHEHDGFHRVDTGREVRIGDGKDGLRPAFTTGSWSVTLSKLVAAAPP